MIRIDPSEIQNWADKPEADLAELVRRLILATLPHPSALEIPSGSSIRMPGWDGLLDVSSGNTWTPDGQSAWEFSCEKGVGHKANRDYTKRTTDPEGVDPAKTTFVFVTARKWKNKTTWPKERQQEHHWADVRALTADDLTAWLDQAPAVAGWFAKIIGKLPDEGVVPLNEWWNTWVSAANPQIIPDLVLAGRHKQLEVLEQWAQGGANSFYVQADTRDEAIAFLAAAANDATSTWGPALLARAVVVQSDDAWRSLEHHPYPLVLIRVFIGDSSSQTAVRNGQHVLTPLDRSQDPRGDGQTLPRLARDETVEALVEMGFTEADARSLIRRTARRLPILYRRLIDEAGYPPPKWAATPSDSLISLALLGQWTDNHEGDKGFIECLIGKSFSEIEMDITALAATPDPPIARVGHRWRFTSHEEAWHILAPRFTASLVDRFQDLAIEVLEQVSPEFELPKEERYLATLGQTLASQRHSEARACPRVGINGRAP